MANKTVDVSEMEAFFYKLERLAQGDLRKEMENLLIGLGEEFLRLIEDEIIRLKVVDTRLLLNSFHKGNENNIWELKEGNLSLEVGSNLEYAAYVNDGHIGVNSETKGAFQLKDGSYARFVPGKWEGDRFIYEKGAKTGMILREKKSDVDGAHYWEWALHILEKMMPNILEAKWQQWMENYFKDLSKLAHDFYK